MKNKVHLFLDMAFKKVINACKISCKMILPLFVSIFCFFAITFCYVVSEYFSFGISSLLLAMSLHLTWNDDTSFNDVLSEHEYNSIYIPIFSKLNILFFSLEMLCIFLFPILLFIEFSNWLYLLLLIIIVPAQIWYLTLDNLKERLTPKPYKKVLELRLDKEKKILTKMINTRKYSTEFTYSQQKLVDKLQKEYDNF